MATKRGTQYQGTALSDQDMGALDQEYFILRAKIRENRAQWRKRRLKHLKNAARQSKLTKKWLTDQPEMTYQQHEDYLRRKRARSARMSAEKSPFNLDYEPLPGDSIRNKDQT